TKYELSNAFSKWVWLPTGTLIGTALVLAALSDMGILVSAPPCTAAAASLCHSALRENWNSLFSTTQCGSEECLAEYLLTFPFYRAAAYSLVGSLFYRGPKNRKSPEIRATMTMKPILAFVFNLTIAALAVPLLALLSAVLVYWFLLGILSSDAIAPFYS